MLNSTLVQEFVVDEERRSFSFVRPFASTVEHPSLTRAQLDAVMGELDTNEGDRVDYGEFVSAIRRMDAARKFAREVTGKLRRSIRDNREGLSSAFDEMDENGDGVLSVEEFQRGLRKHGIDLASSEMQELKRLKAKKREEIMERLRQIQ